MKAVLTLLVYSLALSLTLPAFAGDKPEIKGSRTPAATRTYKLTDVMSKVGSGRYIHITYGIIEGGESLAKVVSSTDDYLVREAKDGNALMVVEAMCMKDTVKPVVYMPGNSATFYCFTN